MLQYFVYSCTWQSACGNILETSHHMLVLVLVLELVLVLLTKVRMEPKYIFLLYLISTVTSIKVWYWRYGGTTNTSIFYARPSLSKAGVNWIAATLTDYLKLPSGFPSCRSAHGRSKFPTTTRIFTARAVVESGDASRIAVWCAGPVHTYD